MLESAVDRLRETVAGAGPVEVGQDVGGSLVQCSAERYPWFAGLQHPGSEPGRGLACVGWSAARRHSIRRAHVIDRDRAPQGARPLVQLGKMGVNGSEFHARTDWFVRFKRGLCPVQIPPRPHETTPG